MKKRITTFFTVIILCTATGGMAQTRGLGSWTIINARYALNKKWMLWGEFQARSYQFYNRFYYHELKGAFQYNVTDAASLLTGIGECTTYTNGGNFKSPVTTHELRLWEQLTLTNNINRIKLEHRYRIEQRWLNSVYRNRFRYRLNVALPINNPKLEPHTFYAAAFDEIFLTDKKPHFERNRIFSGIGYEFSKIVTLQCGYINQYDYHPDVTTVSNNYLMTTLFLNFTKKQSKKEFHPGSVD